MRALYIYNEHSRPELEALERVQTELGNLVEFMGLQEATNQYPITRTPALIIIREDLQGEHLLDENDSGGLRMTAELYKAMEEEELNLHNVETHRIDSLINREVATNVDGAVLDIMMRGVTV